jgi:hypothetical protein
MPTSMGGHWEDSPEVLQTVFAGTHGNDLIKFSSLVTLLCHTKIIFRNLIKSIDLNYKCELLIGSDTQDWIQLFTEKDGDENETADKWTNR